jgi:hypothetical protein
MDYQMGADMANSDALRARATFLYDLAQRVDDWGERLKLRYRAKRLECEAEKLERGEIPEAHVTHLGSNRESA